MNYLLPLSALPEQINIQSSFQKFASLNELAKADKELLEIAMEALKGAYAPYSAFRVGAAVLLGNNKIVTGNNQENAAYPSGLCAERVAVFHASAQYPGIKILALAVSAASEKRELNTPVSPCGACRQSLLEYEVKLDSPIRLIMGASTGPVYVSPSISNLLPLSFNQNSL